MLYCGKLTVDNCAGCCGKLMLITIGILLKSLWKSYPQPGIPAGLSTGAGARATHPLPYPQHKKDPLCSHAPEKLKKNKKEH